MMNKIIKRELEKVRFNIDYDDDTTVIKIPKDARATITVDLKVNHNYNIYVENYILNEPPNFTLSSNWNQGVVPKSKYMNICVTRVMGKMIQVDACGFDVEHQCTLPDTYAGLWLPSAAIHVVKEI